jgi:hypothetical protein
LQNKFNIIYAINGDLLYQAATKAGRWQSIIELLEK